MAIDEKALLKTLAASKDWVEARYLADTFGVTTRTVRNYVRKVNEAHDEPLIEYSHRGYRLFSPAEPAPRTAPAQGAPTDENRTDAILRRLISAQEPVSVYDLAEELYVSDSTIESDLRRVRDTIRLFDLTVTRYRDTVMLKGTERDKRRLIGQMLVSENSTDFVAFTGTGFVQEGYDTTALTKLVASTLAQFNLSADDYGLNGIVVHAIILVNRVRDGQRISDDEDSAQVRTTPGYLAARSICTRLENTFNVTITHGDVAFLALIITSNTHQNNNSDAGANLNGLISEDELRTSRLVLHELERAYLLPVFDDEFVRRFAVHVHGLAQRIPNKVFVRNPLVAKIKQTYPLVYDMAVFLARELETQMGLKLNEDEISFIAFHLGAYLGQDVRGSEKVSVELLYIGYHDLHEAALAKIRDTLGDLVEVHRTSPVSGHDPAAEPCDLLVTPVEIRDKGTAREVIVSPIFGERDLDAIRQAALVVRARKSGAQAYGMIKPFLSAELFAKNVYMHSEREMIEELAARCARAGLCDPSYVDRVLERESLSPTAFGNRVAIPHSMGASTHRSFLYVVVNDKPMHWGDQEVNIIMLMGISEADRKAFRVLFDNLLEVLSEPINVNRLIKSTDFDDFTDRLNSMIMHR